MDFTGGDANKGLGQGNAVTGWEDDAVTAETVGAGQAVAAAAATIAAEDDGDGDNTSKCPASAEGKCGASCVLCSGSGVVSAQNSGP